MKQILSKQVLVDNNSNAPKPGSTAMPISENVDSLRPPGSNPAVNTPGEHSSSEDSDEGSSENDRDEGFDSSKRPERLATTTFPNPSSYASIDLDALINPPSSRDIDKILEIEDHEEEEEEIVLEEEEDDLKFRRHSMGLRTAESSSDEDQASDLPVGADEGNESNASPPAEEGQAQLASPRDLSPSEVHTSFQDINGLGESLETDRRGDAAFSDALAADKAAINLAQASEDDTEVAQSTDETDVSVGKTSLRRQAREGKQKTVQREQGSRDDRVGNVRADKLRNRTEVVTAPDQSGLLQHEDVAEIVTDTTLADNENLHVRQPIVTSSSMGTIRQTPQNQRLEEDPIESTDSFLDDPVQPKTNGLNSVQRERSPSPTRSAPKVVMVKRMKNRSGMVPSTDADVPVPKTDPKAANGSTTATAVPQTIDTQEPGGQIVAKRTRAAGRIVPAPLASVPDTTPKPKGRGHKKTEEEKTFEAAQKLAAKKEKAKLREEKAQAKKQEKARLKEEKGRLQREKAEEKKTVTKKKTGAKPLSVSVEPSATSSGKNLPLPAPSTPPRNDSRSLWPPSSQPQWAALSQSPSAPDRDSPDQLLSSPRGKGTADPLSKEKSPGPNHSDQEDPLFVLTESQVPFPYSQFRSQEEDREEPVTNKKMQRARVNSASSYRRLTDIASQQGLFPVPSLTQSSPVRSVIRNKYHEMDDEDDDEDEDEEDDSGSDSGAEKSHIPLSRRAGVSV
jgi:hypothetical protein